MLFSLLERLVRKVGPQQTVTLAILALALGSVALGLSDGVRGLERTAAVGVVTLGLFVGWRLGRRGRPLWQALPATFGVGIMVVLLWVGRLTAPLAALLYEAGAATGQSPLHRDFSGLLAAWSTFWANAAVLTTRLWAWLLALRQGASAFDPIAVSVAWALVLWLVAVWAGWAVRRRRAPLPALLPAAFLLLGTRSITGGDLQTLLLLVAATLTLIVIVGQEARENHWQAAGWDYSLELRQDLLLATLPLALLLVIFAAAAPSLSVRQLVSAFQRNVDVPDVASAPVVLSLGLEPRPAPTSPFVALRSGGMPREHLLGSGPELSEQIALVVETDDPRTPDIAPRYYWRSITYDRYSGRGWATPQLRTRLYQPREPLLSEALPAHRLVRQRVQVRDHLDSLLYAAGTLVTVDSAFEVASRSNGDVFGVTRAGSSYEAQALVPEVGAEQLRTARTAYPGWVQTRYLQLPDSLPERVWLLAYDLTAATPNAYDRALAIESYLRRIPYTLDLPPPPPNRDMADYFLFDLRRGYCDYYATAMVVLARAAGIPARLAIGYARGSYDWQAGRYTVTGADAHSWPELYFPPYGWIPFEPTAAQPPLARADVVPQPESPVLRSTAPPSGVQWAQVRDLGAWLLLGVLGATVAGGGWVLADYWRLRRMNPAAAVTLLFHRLVPFGPRIGTSVQPGATPYEVASALTRQLDTQWREGRWARQLAPARNEIHTLTNLYVRVTYGAYEPDFAAQRHALEAWHRLQARLWLAALLWRASRLKRPNTLQGHPHLPLRRLLHLPNKKQAP
jgi:transglutaminase-like putative cysteine protease